MSVTEAAAVPPDCAEHWLIWIDVEHVLCDTS